MKLQKSDISDVILAMIECNLNKREVAKYLNLHYNSVNYRIEVIENKTGLDVRKVKDLIKLANIYNIEVT